MLVGAARYQSTQGQASLFTITVASKAPAKHQVCSIPTPTKKTHLALQQKNFLFLVCEAVPSPNSHGVKVSLFLEWRMFWRAVFGKKKTTEVAHLDN
nr:hypothetical protein CFP56_29065 [Quercus suber]